jgi:hypothetical protein
MTPSGASRATLPCAGPCNHRMALTQFRANCSSLAEVGARRAHGRRNWPAFYKGKHDEPAWHCFLDDGLGARALGQSCNRTIDAAALGAAGRRSCADHFNAGGQGLGPRPWEVRCQAATASRQKAVACRSGALCLVRARPLHRSGSRSHRALHDPARLLVGQRLTMPACRSLERPRKIRINSAPRNGPVGRCARARSKPPSAQERKGRRPASSSPSKGIFLK